MRTSSEPGSTAEATPPPLPEEQPRLAIVRKITREDVEAMAARRAGLAPVAPEPLDIGLWSQMRHQLALGLCAAVSAFSGDSPDDRPNPDQGAVQPRRA